MNRILLASLVAFVAAVWASAHVEAARVEAGLQTRLDQPATTDVVSTVSRTYCITCHNDRVKTGGLSLEGLSPDRDAETWEKAVRKVRAGLMPPAGAKRPERAALDAFAASIETAIDRTAAVNPNPGRVPLHRMNRVEYANAIRDLLSLDIDSSTLLPADDSSHGFDNIADVLG